MTEEAEGGRIFFSSTGRSLVDEDEIVVLSVGVDIGSSTSHLVFSRIVLERLDSRYVVTTRETFYQSDILLTPYSTAGRDRRRRARRLHRAPVQGRQDRSRRDRHRRADPHRRRRAPAQRPQHRRTVRGAGRQDGRGLGRRQPRDGDGRLRLGRGGALDPRQRDGDECRHRRRHLEDRDLRRRQGDRPHRVDVGARLVCLDADGRITRIEEAGRRFGAELGIELELGGALAPEDARAAGGAAWPIGCSRPCTAARRASAALACCGSIRSRIAADRPRSPFPAACRNTSTAAKPELRRSRRAAGAGNPRAGRKLGTAARTLRTRASAPPWSAPRNTPRR